MSAKQLIELLEKHVKLHKGLLDLANKKTEVLKKGDMEALSEMMKEEQKYIAAITQVERERVRVVNEMIGEANEPTLTACISQTEGTERAMLEKLRDDLTAVISELKNINLLNQQLTQQSLQFVNMMLDMFMPQPPNINYAAPNKVPNPYEGSSSLFDSKA
ncbi:flagellar protein FlgN [Parageobacillus toebii]|uniref:flagellar protein FlgN n=1 Tax=Parageobacillus toebii TaxID=153151 RepID=UPI002816499E|nr:flagellar protein FlgN [Parageobacillus toebii]WMT19807.1 flagellar protein FlgN [Parageobacillus toebii]